MEEILEILKDLHDDIDFMAENRLVDDKILDSFDLITLVSELCERFDIEITAKEFVPENFNSVKALSKLVRELSGEC